MNNHTVTDVIATQFNIIFAYLNWEPNGSRSKGEFQCSFKGL